MGKEPKPADAVQPLAQASPLNVLGSRMTPDTIDARDDEALVESVASAIYDDIAGWLSDDYIWGPSDFRETARAALTAYRNHPVEF